METCFFSNFIQTLKPWLNDDYIKMAFWDEQGNFGLRYIDGGEKIYRIDDCTQAQLKEVIQMLKANGIDVIKQEIVCEKIPPS